MPKNEAWIFHGPEAWRRHERELAEQRQRLRQLEAEAARLRREAGVIIAPQLLVGTTFDKQRG